MRSFTIRSGQADAREQRVGHWDIPARRQARAIELKRCFDLLAAIAGIIVLSPLFGAIALAIRVRDPGPLLFPHVRIGRDGRKFSCLKFRTMVQNADAVLETHLRENPAAEREWRETRKLRDDPRVTPLGRALRKTSLDELPQLINVLRGEMSVVGPRPIVIAELSRYGAARKEYLSVRPGITGLWQISGRNDTSYAERVQLDAKYVRTRTFWLDCVIICRTVVVVFFQKGSY